jgi:hypothetical protein
MVSANGMGAPWKPATCSTASASASVPPEPPTSSGMEIHGSPMPATASHSSGAHCAVSAAARASGVQVSAKTRSAELSSRSSIIGAAPVR